MTSFIVKPIYSDDNKGATFEMWKDPIRMDKWLQNPSPNHTHIRLDGDNGIFIDITVKEYNHIQNQAQMIFCSTCNWPIYCIEFILMKSDNIPEKEIIDLLKSKYQN